MTIWIVAAVLVAGLLFLYALCHAAAASDRQLDELDIPDGFRDPEAKRLVTAAELAELEQNWASS